MSNQEIINKATSAIISAASRNTNITAAGLRDELENGMIEGWLGLPAVEACTLSQWSAAMSEAIKTIQALEDLGV